jgi:hypothetical protein
VRFRLILLAPVLAFLALASWAMASPVGAAPDDDFHLVSIWCDTGDPSHCQETGDPATRVVPQALLSVACYAFHPETSAGCQDTYFAAPETPNTVTKRGNFASDYPPVFYKVESLFVGSSIEASALAMRLFNAALFVVLSTIVFVLLPVKRRPNLLWGWLLTTVPLGLFVIASNNPSGWAAVGVGTAWISLLGYYESEGRRRWGLAATFAVSVLMAAGSRGDAAVYVVVAMVAVMVMTFAHRRSFYLASILPLVGAIVAFVFFLRSGQVDIGASGFSGTLESAPRSDAHLSAFALFSNNLLEVPFLWVGAFGAWNLGWLDTGLPYIVLWAGAASFIGAGFVGLASVNARKAMVIGGVALLLIGIPTYVLTVSGDQVGSNLQPRYLLPLIILFGGLLMMEPAGKRIRLTRVQLLAIGLALPVSNMAALEANIRRYVTGIDKPGLSLDAGREWWWHVPFGANAVWIVGTLAFAGLVYVLLREIHRAAAPAAATPHA